MTYTNEDFKKEFVLEHLDLLSPDDCLKGLLPDERLKGLSATELKALLEKLQQEFKG